jgi:hypothetical protein
MKPGMKIKQRIEKIIIPHALDLRPQSFNSTLQTFRLLLSRLGRLPERSIHALLMCHNQHQRLQLLLVEIEIVGSFLELNAHFLLVSDRCIVVGTTDLLCLCILQFHLQSSVLGFEASELDFGDFLRGWRGGFWAIEVEMSELADGALEAIEAVASQAIAHSESEVVLVSNETDGYRQRISYIA